MGRVADTIRCRQGGSDSSIISSQETSSNDFNCNQLCRRRDRVGVRHSPGDVYPSAGRGERDDAGDREGDPGRGDGLPQAGIRRPERFQPYHFRHPVDIHRCGCSGAHPRRREVAAGDGDFVPGGGGGVGAGGLHRDERGGEDQYPNNSQSTGRAWPGAEGGVLGWGGDGDHGGRDWAYRGYGPVLDIQRPVYCGGIRFWGVVGGAVCQGGWRHLHKGS